MKIIIVLFFSFLVAFLATLISYGVGVLVAPWVYYTIDGGLFRVQVSDEVTWYLKVVFFSHFLTALISSLLVTFTLSIMRNKRT